MVLTFGDVWAQLFEDSLSRKMAGIIHLQAGKPDFKVTPELLAQITEGESDHLTKIRAEAVATRINSTSTQASELVWKLETLILFSDIVFVETKMLDTAIGQYVISRAKGKCWAVGVDNSLSPLAPYYLRGVVYPQSPDDLVTLALNERGG